MQILTLDNAPYDLDQLPDEVDDMRFAILDNSDPANPDYHYIPLIFLERDSTLQRAFNFYISTEATEVLY